VVVPDAVCTGVAEPAAFDASDVAHGFSLILTASSNRDRNRQMPKCDAGGSRSLSEVGRAPDRRSSAPSWKSPVLMQLTRRGLSTYSDGPENVRGPPTRFSRQRVGYPKFRRRRPSAADGTRTGSSMAKIAFTFGDALISSWRSHRADRLAALIGCSVARSAAPLSSRWRTIS
jgi:hypothetical protein